MNQNDKFYIPLIVALSVIIPLAVAGLMFLPDDLRLSFGGADLRSLPFFHAVLNASTAVLLFVGFVWIKNKKIALHRISMMSAFILSAIFLGLASTSPAEVYQVFPSRYPTIEDGFS